MTTVFNNYAARRIVENRKANQVEKIIRRKLCLFLSSSELFNIRYKYINNFKHSCKILRGQTISHFALAWCGLDVTDFYASQISMHNVYVFYIFFCICTLVDIFKENTRKEKFQIFEIDINEENSDVIIL